MGTQVAIVGVDETLRQAGHRMRELGVGALRVRGEDGRLRGTVSHDMIVLMISAGGYTRFHTVGDLTPQPPRPVLAGCPEPEAA